MVTSHVQGVNEEPLMLRTLKLKNPQVECQTMDREINKKQAKLAANDSYYRNKSIWVGNAN